MAADEVGRGGKSSDSIGFGQPSCSLTQKLPPLRGLTPARGLPARGLPIEYGAFNGGWVPRGAIIESPLALPRTSRFAARRERSSCSTS